MRAGRVPIRDTMTDGSGAAAVDVLIIMAVKEEHDAALAPVDLVRRSGRDQSQSAAKRWEPVPGDPADSGTHGARW